MSSTETTTAALSHPKYRPDIDGLRAIAVLSVVIFHAFPNSLKSGFIGVDIFFVISGYLISSIIFENMDRGSFSFGSFYGRRIKRIFPALTLVLLSCLVFGWFGLLGDEFKQLGKHMAAGAGFVSNFYLWQEVGYFNNAAETKPLLHLWSLAIEEQFYIFWPLLVWLTWKRKTLFLVVFGTLLLGSFAYNVYWVRPDPTATFYSPATRIWELLMGVLLAYFSLQNRPNGAVDSTATSSWQNSKKLRQVASTVGVLLLVFGLYKIDKGRPFPGTWAVFPVLGSFLLIFAGPQAWFNRFVLSNRVLVWVGLISFPLYLWHWPILSFMRIIESGTPSAHLRNLAVLASIVLAWMTYYFVEKPIRSGERNNLKIVVLASLVTALGLAGTFIYQNNGIPSRQAAQADGVNVWDNYAFAGTCKLVTQAPESDDWCNMGNAPEKPPTTLLIGDSVGNNFAPMLNDFAAANADSSFVFRQMGRGLCHGLPEIGYDNCKAMVAATDTYIDKTPSIHTIIMAANWPLYYDGFEKGTADKVTHTQFKAAFEARVTRYQALGKRVIVFLTPPAGVSPRACVVRPIRLTSSVSDASNCVMARKDAVTNDGHYRSYFESLLAQKGIATFDPFKYMCDDKTCKVTDGTRIYYLDHEHFSIFGGQFLAKVAGDELKQLLSNPSNIPK